MPIHDWTKVDAGIFHSFHGGWIIHIQGALNGGLLPKGYYAMSEQRAGLGIADILTLQTKSGEALVPPNPRCNGGIAVARPNVERLPRLTISLKNRRRTLTIRHVSRHQIVALVEIVSPSNKDRPANLEKFVKKAVDALEHGVNLLLIDLFAPGPHDAGSLISAIAASGDNDSPPMALPADKPLTLASFDVGFEVDTYMENLAVGGELPDMPLFLGGDLQIETPLSSTYEAAYRGMPEYWREVLEGRQQAENVI